MEVVIFETFYPILRQIKRAPLVDKTYLNVGLSVTFVAFWLLFAQMPESIQWLN
jgi:hypothetical protein